MKVDYLNKNYFFCVFLGAWYKHDNEDRPLFILRLGVMDVKGIIKSVRINGFEYCELKRVVSFKKKLKCTCNVE